MSLSMLRFSWRRAAARTMSYCGRRMMNSSSSDPSTVSPWLMLSDRSGSGAGHKFYNLVSKKVVSFKKQAAPPSEMLIGSSHGWLASVDLENCGMFLSDPISGRRMKLPAIQTVPIEDDLSNYHATQMEKIILTSSPSDDDCIAVMLFGKRGMALWRPGDDKWTHAGNRYVDDVVYARRRRRLYCITRDLNDEPEEIECWDLTNYHHPKVEWKVFTSDAEEEEEEESDDDEEESESDDDDEEEEESFATSTHLVFSEQSDQLFVVRRVISILIGVDGSFVKSFFLGADRRMDLSKPNQTSSFEVYEIIRNGNGNGNGERSSQRVAYRSCRSSLNGLAMFIGINHALALRAEDFSHELKPDSIYFTEALICMPKPTIHYYKHHGGQDVGVFNYVDKTFSSVYYPRHHSQITKLTPPPTWFTPTPHY